MEFQYKERFLHSLKALLSHPLSCQQSHPRRRRCRTPTRGPAAWRPRSAFRIEQLCARLPGLLSAQVPKRPQHGIAPPLAEDVVDVHAPKVDPAQDLLLLPQGAEGARQSAGFMGMTNACIQGLPMHGAAKRAPSHDVGALRTCPSTSRLIRSIRVSPRLSNSSPSRTQRIREVADAHCA